MVATRPRHCPVQGPHWSGQAWRPPAAGHARAPTPGRPLVSRVPVKRTHDGSGEGRRPARVCGANRKLAGAALGTQQPTGTYASPGAPTGSGAVLSAPTGTRLPHIAHLAELLCVGPQSVEDTTPASTSPCDQRLLSPKSPRALEVAQHGPSCVHTCPSSQRPPARTTQPSRAFSTGQ